MTRRARESASITPADAEEAKPPRDDEPGLPKMHAGFERIVRDVYEVDVWESYRRIRDLRLPVTADRASRDDLRRALGDADANARDAFLLWCNAKVALEAWEADCEIARAHLHAEAQTRLAEEKAAGRHPKAITNDDVQAEIAREHPDEMRRQRVGRERRKRMVDALEDLAARWRDRRSSLEALLGAARI